MIIPRFWLKQDDLYVYIFVKVVHAKMQNSEISISDNTFIFCCDPYFLRLNFRNEIVPDSNGDCDCSYDIDQGVLKFSVLKREKGEFFNDLDMLTKLMSKPPPPRRPIIEEISDSNGSEDSPGPPTQQLGQRYGFAGRRNPREDGNFHLQPDYSDVFDQQAVLKDAKVREQTEDDKFDDSHYVVDMIDEDGDISSLLLAQFTETDLSHGELDAMKELPKRSYLLDRDQVARAKFGLVDILLAYCYENVVTGGEFNVESPWTVSKLAATLSCCAEFESTDEVVRSFARRCLCYPLYRSRKLVEHVKTRTVGILSSKISVIRCLIGLRNVFVSDLGHYYVLNELFVEDYCVWAQTVAAGELARLGNLLELCPVEWDQVGFDIPQLEIAASLVILNK